MGMCANRALSNMVKPQPFLTWPIPEGWSLRDAATVPVVYGTAIFGLVSFSSRKKYFHINCEMANSFLKFFISL